MIGIRWRVECRSRVGACVVIDQGNERAAAAADGSRADAARHFAAVGWQPAYLVSVVGVDRLPGPLADTWFCPACVRELRSASVDSHHDKPRHRP